MKLFRKIMFILILIIIQFSLLPRFHLKYLEPDLLLALTILFGLMRGAEYGSITGFILGLFTDVNTGAMLGAGAFSWTQVGFASALVGDKLLVDNPLVQMFVVGCGSMLAGVLQLIFLQISSTQDPGIPMFFLLISRAVMTAVLSYPLSRIAIRLELIPEHHHEQI